MVNVTNRPNVAMGLRAVELFLGHRGTTFAVSVELELA
jgi:hypothetical protein